MKLSASNIAWSAENDEKMYSFLRDNGFTGLEIAPTRIFPNKPYEHLAEAKAFANRLFVEYGLRISSIQSIWYGRNENIFGSADERQALLDYTKRAIDFAVTLECGNLVFGCPKNRNVPEVTKNAESTGMVFFSALADYASNCGTVIALEPNPPIYNTNFINNTSEAFAFCRTVDNYGLKVNVDLGTMIYYDELVSLIQEHLDLVNHIHLSEPKLVPLERRELHKNILALPFDKYFSVEMSNCGGLQKVMEAIEYVKNLAE